MSSLYNSYLNRKSEFHNLYIKYYILISRYMYLSSENDTYKFSRVFVKSLLTTPI